MYRGVVAVCHGGGFGGYSWRRESAGGSFLVGAKRGYPVQTSRAIKPNGEAGSAQWIL